MRTSHVDLEDIDADPAALPRDVQEAIASWQRTIANCKGDRRSRLAEACGELLRFGKAKGDTVHQIVVDRLADIGRANGFSDDEMQEIMARGEAATNSHDLSGRPQHPEVTLRTHRDRNTSSPKWLIKKLLPECGIGLLSGQWGTGKTAVVLDLAAAVAIEGSTFAGLPIKRRGVALLFCLEGEDMIQPRLEALSRDKYGGAYIPGYFTAEPIRLLDEGDEKKKRQSGTDRVIKIAKTAMRRAQEELKLPLALIIFDTMIMAAGYTGEGAEQDNVISARIMQAFRKIEKETGALVLGVDHYGKNVEAGSRGASAKEDAADVIIALLGDRDQSGKVSNRRMVVRKLRSGAAGAEHAFDLKVIEIGEDGEVDSSIVVDWDAVRPSSNIKKTGGKAAALLLHVVATLPTQPHRPWPEGPAVQAVQEKAVREEFYKQYVVGGEPDPKKATEAKRRAYTRAMAAAQPKSLMQRDGWIWTLRLANQRFLASKMGDHVAYMLRRATASVYQPLIMFRNILQHAT
jgi:hypothetical protein